MGSLALLIGLACIGVAIVLAVWLIAAPSSEKEEAAQAAAAAPGAPNYPAPAGGYPVPMSPQPSYPGTGMAPMNYAPSAAGVLTATPGSAPVAPPMPKPGELPPLMQRLREVALRLSPAGYGAWLRRQLDFAGNPTAWPADRVLAFKGVGLVAGILFGALIGLGHGLLLVLLAAVGGTFCFFLPDILIYNAAGKRQAQLLKGLPDALDMMTVCVEAGLGFDSALSRVALNLDGPIATETARVLQEMQFGMSRIEALRSLAERTSVAEIRTFVSAMVQSSELGISIGVVLREQAREMRIRRRQRAEEKAQKLQVKIVVPLVLCLLPALFVIVIGPGVLNIIHAFGNAHHH